MMPAKGWERKMAVCQSSRHNSDGIISVMIFIVVYFFVGNLASICMHDRPRSLRPWECFVRVAPARDNHSPTGIPRSLMPQVRPLAILKEAPYPGPALGCITSQKRPIVGEIVLY